MSAERQRQDEARERGVPWARWGPYLSERQWGTVREDYSDSGDAWSYLPHDHARSRAYRWGEDGLAGISDDQQRLCFALALWNGQDPILKERLFGLTNSEGNHGEDVKEYYFYLDSTPTHSYMKYLYKYPQAAYPYGDLLETNRDRGRGDAEYELLDTGVFDDDRYFDVLVEYAKATPDDLLVEITVTNRGPESATLDVLPTIWFRNTWSWGDDAPEAAAARCEHAIERGHRGVAPGPGRPIPRLRGLALAALHGERDQHRPTVRDSLADPVRQGRHRPVHRPGRTRRREPGAERDESRGPLRADGSRGWIADRSPATVGDGADARRPRPRPARTPERHSGPTSTRSSTSVARRPTRSTRRSSRRPWTPIRRW